MKMFYVFRRGKRKNYYVQFVDPLTGRLNSARSTGKENYQEALQQAYIMLQTASVVKPQWGVVDSLQQALSKNSLTQSDIARLREMLGINSQEIVYIPQVVPTEVPKIKTPFLQWLRGFWVYETSEYIQDKLSHGKRISKRHCYDQTLIVKYWAEFFTDDTMLEDITLVDLQDFEKYLWEKQTQKKRIVEDEKTGKKHVELYYTQLSTKTRNSIISCGSIAFDWALRKKMVLENPCKGLTAYSVKAQKRDILTKQEASKLFSQGTWKDDRARIASLVAMTTGLRVGEILALQVDDIGEDRLFISKSWSVVSGLTCTKNGENRVVPLVPHVKAELYKLHLQNPHREKGDKFIFFGTLPHKPMVANIATDYYYKLALDSIGISEVQRQRRNIVFHSWRHFYATTIATELSEKHAQLTLGHLTSAMTKHYADHKTEEALMSVCSASNEIFAQMLHA